MGPTGFVGSKSDPSCWEQSGSNFSRSSGSLAWDDTAGNTYDVDLAGGTYEVWVRCRVPGEFGYGLGGARSDGAWVGINGRPMGGVRSGAVEPGPG